MNLTSLWSTVKKHTLIFVVLGILLLMYSYRLTENTTMDSDFGRDLADIATIAGGKMMLLGPKLSFGGVHTGPYYYYLFVPIYLLARLAGALAISIELVIIAQALLTVVTFAAIYAVLVRHFGRTSSALGIALLGLTNTYFFIARNPGNAFTYFPLLSLLLIIAIHTLQSPIQWSARQIALFGLGVGMCMNMHPVSLIALFPMLGVVLMAQRTWYARLRYVIIMGAVVLLTWTPFFLFELRHDFIQLKNTFQNKSYQVYLDNKNLENTPPSKNIFANAAYIDPRVSWITPGHSLLILVIMTLLMSLYARVKRKGKGILGLVALVGYLLTLLAVRNQFAFHYVLPAIVLTITLLIWEILSVTWRRPLILGLIIGIMLATSQPWSWYGNTKRPISLFYMSVQDIKKQIVGLQKDIPTAIIGIRKDTDKAPHGHEYRYFLIANGYTISTISEYAQAGQALIIDETGGATEVSRLGSWEYGELQKAGLTLKQIYSIQGSKVYFYQK